MTDVNGYRAKFGNIVPSTNTTVEYDVGELRLRGVTFHSGRILVEQPELPDEESVRQQIASLDRFVERAFAEALTVKPDYMLMGMSGPTFWGGKAGAAAFEEKVRGFANGLGVTTGAMACEAALRKLGAHTVGVVSPYQPVAEENVRQYLTDYGYEVTGMRGFGSTSMTSIAEITPAEVIQAFKDVDRPDVDVILQVGTDLSAVRLADEAERWLGKPVVAINAATVWHGLRAVGIDDQLHGHGIMLREF